MYGEVTQPVGVTSLFVNYHVFIDLICLSPGYISPLCLWLFVLWYVYAVQVSLYLPLSFKGTALGRLSDQSLTLGSRCPPE